MTRSLVVGAGSIGLRHARVLAALGHEVSLVSRRELPDANRFPDVATAIAQAAPDYTVVATETSRHAGTVAELSAAGFAGVLLVEKPLAAPATAFAGFARVGVGFNLRFHPAFARFAQLLESVEVYSVEAYAGQHLAQWRPGRDGAYSSSRELGGGALRDLSHELDYLGWMLGPCRGVFARGGRLAEVTLDSDDAWGIVAEYERASVVTLQVNYLDTRPRRRLVATTAAGTIEADLIAGTVQNDDGIERFTVERDDTYTAMHRAMLGEGDATDSIATIADAAATDILIDLIETSAAEARWVAAA